jgi:hypothetical protein
VQVSKPGIFANFTYTDLLLNPNGIQCRTLDAGFYELEFKVISDTEIGITHSRHAGPPWNPERTCEFIMRKMVEQIELRER